MAAALSVKWGKETHAVSLSAACASGAQVKAALAAATGVPAARQKVMCKAWKGVLADDADVLAGWREAPAVEENVFARREALAFAHRRAVYAFTWRAVRFFSWRKRCGEAKRGCGQE